LQVRVLPGPPAFAREASEGCHAEAHRAKAGWARELRQGKPTGDPPKQKISKTTPCTVAKGRSHQPFFLPRKRFDMSGKSAVLPHRRADREFVDRTADRFGANTLQKSES